MIVLWFVTSSDSASFVIDMLTAGGDTNPPKIQRLFWASTEGIIAAVLLAASLASALLAAALLAAALLTAANPFSKKSTYDVGAFSLLLSYYTENSLNFNPLVIPDKPSRYPEQARHMLQPVQ